MKEGGGGERVEKKQRLACTDGWKIVWGGFGQDVLRCWFRLLPGMLLWKL
jgi:hypothetical protein